MRLTVVGNNYIIKVKMRKGRSALIILFFFILLPVLNAALAAYLKFDRSSYNGSVGSEFTVKVMIDTEGEEVVSSDVYISYDATVLEPLSVAAGDFFDTVTHEFLDGKIYVAGMSDNIGVGKTGTGVIATVTFRAKSSGSTTLTYICDPNETQSSKIIKVGLEAENIIVCGSNKSATVDIASGGDSALGAAEEKGAIAEDSSGITPSELPKAGAFDNTIELLFWGGILIFFGVLLKFVFL